MSEPEPNPEIVGAVRRRAVDAIPAGFGAAGLKALAAGQPPLAVEVETIDLDSHLPPGSEAGAAAPAPTPLSPEEKRHRLGMVKFKQDFEDFETIGPLSQIHFKDLKRGDCVEIRTIVGSAYLKIADRLPGPRAGSGEIVCDCRYDLTGQLGLDHAAVIQLPIFARHHRIVSDDGSSRLASRALKMTVDSPLPKALTDLLHERFFEALLIHSGPEAEKLRAIDVWRGLVRIALKIKALIDENNRREREKAMRKSEAARRRKEERQRRREERAR